MPHRIIRTVFHRSEQPAQYDAEVTGSRQALNVIADFVQRRVMTSKKNNKDKIEVVSDDLIASPAEPITVDPTNVTAYDSAPNASPVMTSSTAYPEVVEVKKEAAKKHTTSSTSKKTSD